MGRHEVEGFNLRPLDAHQPILASSKSRGEWCNYPRVIESKFLQSRKGQGMRMDVSSGCGTFELEAKQNGEWNLIRRFEVTEETVLTYSESNVISRSLDDETVPWAN